MNMMTNATNLATAKLFYQQFNNPNAKAPSAEQLKAIYDSAARDNADVSKVEEAEFIRGYNLMRTVAAQVTEQEWLEWQASGTLPIVKLTPAQMEFARGGVALELAILAVYGAWTVGFLIGQGINYLSE